MSLPTPMADRPYSGFSSTSERTTKSMTCRWTFSKNVYHPVYITRRGYPCEKQNTTQSKTRFSLEYHSNITKKREKYVFFPDFRNIYKIYTSCKKPHTYTVSYKKHSHVRKTGGLGTRNCFEAGPKRSSYDYRAFQYCTYVPGIV